MILKHKICQLPCVCKKNEHKNLRYKFILVFLTVFGIQLLANYTAIENLKSEAKNQTILIKSRCACRKDIELVKKNSNLYVVKHSSFFGLKKISLANLSQKVISCDYYSYFQRGPNLKVISYSLYGKASRYYDQLRKLPKLVSKHYPDWIMRVYYDDSIDYDIICELECSHRNVDFCHASSLPRVTNNGMFSNKQNLSNLHSMMWRWYALGDLNVDAFMSRDTDSLVIEREVASVNEWLKSNKTTHIMRDHHQHKREILGGMWGFYSRRNRSLAEQLFRIYSDHNLVLEYKQENKYDLDQKFLADFVYPLVLNDSVTHDSYYCELYANSMPFPTRRNGAFCHVGFIGDCSTSTTVLQDCPIKCRPKEHLDWNLC